MSHDGPWSCLKKQLSLAIGSAIGLLLISPITASAQVDATTLPCNFGKAVKSGDKSKTLRLAMIVGVNRYIHLPEEDQLKGAVADAGKFYDLIVEDEKKIFPKENVCVLTNEEATYEGFKAAFQKAIVDRAEGAEEVVIYYAGHGSQLYDGNKDDGDGWDETLFLHDSSKRDKPREGIRYNQLRDDEFNSMLAALQEKTRRFTVILDSCHSGTATRDIGGNKKARLVKPDLVEAARQAPVSEPPASGGDGGFSYANFGPASFPEAVFLSAARDSERAYEDEVARVGLFTTALVSVLRSDSRLTYKQLNARIGEELGADAPQTPVLSGDGERLIFSGDIPYRPRFDWVVAEAEEASAIIRGLPTIGMGEGAEFLILPGSMTAEEAKDPMIAKARMKAVALLGTNEWRLDLIEDFGRGAINPGDFARLVRPSASARRLKVRLRPTGELGGISDPEMLSRSIVDGLENVLKPGDIPLLEFVVEGDFDLEISSNALGAFQLTDPGGVLRNAYEQADENVIRALARDLSNHLQQIVLRRDWKISGGSLVPNKSLAVRLEPVVDDRFNLCKKQYKGTDWPGPANAPQRIPLCASYRIFVKLDKNAPIPLIVGGTVMSADGSMVGLPSDKRRIELAPAEEQAFDLIFQATPESYGKPETIFVIGLPAKPTAGEPAYQIPWHLLSTGVPRSRASVAGRDERSQREYGTYTALSVMTIANPGFGEETNEQLNAKVVTREYTINNFNIAPYLPDDPDSTLYRILKVAENLANVDGTGDGVPYKQHSWCQGSTSANLAQGIDCSRAIWYAFTRAGLPYNKYATTIPDEAQCVKPYDPTNDGYLYTGDMARGDYLMSEEFEDCLAPENNPDGRYRLGDVLVYRDKTRGDGHVVMVIDPEQRIAWGSHGWDGNPRLVDPDTGEAPDADRGVEFQKIKFKSDWERWDRGTMELAACWRHKAFIAEERSGKGRPGFAALCEAIDLEDPYAKGSLCWKLSR